MLRSWGVMDLTGTLVPSGSWFTAYVEQLATALGLGIGWRLYLPEAWAGDPVRRTRAGIPDDAIFQTKPAIALDQIRRAVAAGVPTGVVLMDAGYGTDTDLRAGIGALGLTYVAGVHSPPASGRLG